MPDSLHIGIIGCGSMGEAHARCLRDIGGVELASFCDVEESRARKLKEKFNGADTTVEAGQVFRDKAITVVYICTHHDSHAELAIEAIEQGKHVFMEKPLALNMEDAVKIGEVLQRKPVSFMVGFKLRFNPSVEKARAFIARPVLSIGQVTDDRWPDLFWGNDPQKGGGNVLSQGCHAMDILRFVHRGEPVRVYAEGGNCGHPRHDIIDTLVATISFLDGAVSTVAVGDCGKTSVASKFSFQFMDGSKCAHLYNRLKSVALSDGNKETRYHCREELGLMNMNRAFVNTLLCSDPPPVTYYDGLQAMRMIFAAFESLKSGVPRDIPRQY